MEAPMDRRAIHAPLQVHVSFETTRISTQSLIDVYECLAPTRRRSLAKAPEISSPADEIRAMPSRGGEHG
jgi:hypothetical protein